MTERKIEVNDNEKEAAQKEKKINSLPHFGSSRGRRRFLSHTILAALAFGTMGVYDLLNKSEPPTAEALQEICRVGVNIKGIEFIDKTGGRDNVFDEGIDEIVGPAIGFSVRALGHDGKILGSTAVGPDGLGRIRNIIEPCNTLGPNQRPALSFLVQTNESPNLAPAVAEDGFAANYIFGRRITTEARVPQIPSPIIEPTPIIIRPTAITIPSPNILVVPQITSTTELTVPQPLEVDIGVRDKDEWWPQLLLPASVIGLGALLGGVLGGLLAGRRRSVVHERLVERPEGTPVTEEEKSRYGVPVVGEKIRESDLERRRREEELRVKTAEEEKEKAAEALRKERLAAEIARRTHEKNIEAIKRATVEEEKKRAVEEETAKEANKKTVEKVRTRKEVREEEIKEKPEEGKRRRVFYRKTIKRVEKVPQEIPEGENRERTIIVSDVPELVDEKGKPLVSRRHRRIEEGKK